MRILWTTNLQAPYRESVWRVLAQVTDLEVGFLASGSVERPWSYHPRPDYKSRVLCSWELPWTNPDQGLYLLLRRLRTTEVDVLILGSWESPAYWQLLLDAKRSRTATVAFLEAGLNSSRYTGGHPIARLRRRFFRSVDAVLTAGETATAIAKAMGVDPARTVTGFNNVDASLVVETVARTRATEPPLVTGHRYLFVGRLLERKRVPLLIEAFEEINEPDDELWLVGDGPSLPQIEEAILACPAEVRSRIRRYPFQAPEDVYSIMGRCHTLVLPSAIETWGMVINEALAAGIHVVTTEAVGAARSVHGMPGVYIAGGDALGLGIAMAQSRASWLGPISSPAILSKTPQSAVDDVLEAVRLAMVHRESRE